MNNLSISNHTLCSSVFLCIVRVTKRNTAGYTDNTEKTHRAQRILFSNLSLFRKDSGFNRKKSKIHMNKGIKEKLENAYKNPGTKFCYFTGKNNESVGKIQGRS